MESRFPILLCTFVSHHRQHSTKLSNIIQTNETTDFTVSNNLGCSGVVNRGNAFPPLFALVTLFENFDFSFKFLHVAPGTA